MKAKKNKKKMNTYLKYGLIMLACVVVGMVLGRMIGETEDGLGILGEVVGKFTETFRSYVLETVSGLFILEILLGEIYLQKMKKLWNAAETADEEERDHIDHETEKAGAVGTGVIGVVTLLATITVTNVISKQYFIMLEIIPLLKVLGSFLVFILVYVYNGYWGVRMVKLEQKKDPTKKGDPTSMKFQIEYVESCDEAEKEQIYQSAFYSFTMMSRIYGVAVAVAMLMHMIWNTGITAVVFVGTLQVLHNLFYLKYSVRKKEKK